MKTHRDAFPQEAQREKVESPQPELTGTDLPKQVFIHFRGGKAKPCEGRRKGGSSRLSQQMVSGRSMETGSDKEVSSELQPGVQ